MQALVTPLQPMDDLETSLINSWRDVSRATCRFLVLLREFDLRQGWQAWGSADCADWLNLKCGITRNTAQEKLRVAKSLWDLPQIEAAFEQGDRLLKGPRADPCCHRQQRSGPPRLCARRHRRPGGGLLPATAQR